MRKIILSFLSLIVSLMLVGVVNAATVSFGTIGVGATAAQTPAGVELFTPAGLVGSGYVRLDIPGGIALNAIASLSYTAQITAPGAGGFAPEVVLNIDSDGASGLEGTGINWMLSSYNPATLNGDNFLSGDQWPAAAGAPDGAPVNRDALTGYNYWSADDPRTGLSPSLWHPFFTIVPGMLPVHGIDATDKVFSIDFVAGTSPNFDGLRVVFSSVELNGVIYNLKPKNCNDPDMICDMGTVSQEAEISGSGSPPMIKYLWVLPDEDDTQPETQLKPDLSQERNDIYACIVVRDPNGRDDISFVFARVYHPTGTGDILPCVEDDGELCDDSGFGQPWEKNGALFKYQVHATKLDPTSDRTEIEQCKQDALNAGLINQTEYDDIDYEIFSQPDAFMYKVPLPMLYHQPAGWYRVEARASDKGGEVSNEKNRSFEWVSTVALQIDFHNGINYGHLEHSVYKVVQGDWDMTTPALPTVKNEGNERIALTISTDTLTGHDYGKNLTDFDVKWDPEEEGYGYGQTYFQAGDMVYLDCTGEDETPLELCQTEKIDFSVHAPDGKPEDTYTGDLTIEASAFIPGLCPYEP